MSDRVDVYIESGSKRTFAGAVGWPGWCRRGRDEGSALQALSDYGRRYAGVLEAASIPFTPPATPEMFSVVERLAGNSTTDFGAPAIAPSADALPVDAAELGRLIAVLDACWQAFDRALETSQGRELRKGPRGGGRDQAKMLTHVVDAEQSYLSRLGWTYKPGDVAPEYNLRLTREAIREGLAASARGEIAPQGPRGGQRWTARYFVRRAAWHVLDHAWEIEDRTA